MLSSNENVRDGLLAADLLESALNLVSVWHLVEFESLKVDVSLFQECLSVNTVGAVRLRVDHDLLGCDFLLQLGL